MSELAAQHSERRRLLGLMGVDVYERRVRGSGPAVQLQVQVAEAPPAYVEPAPAAKAQPAAVASIPSTTTRVVFALPAESGNGFEGVHGPLLRSLTMALELREAQVGFDALRTDLPWLCFRAPPLEVSHAVLAPPLSTLRASAAAKRALWQSLRPLLRQLRN